MNATIELRDLRKRYGRTVAVDGLSFTVAPGEVTAFVGPNGAGKSTTMRVILGLDAPDEGAALVGGQPYRSLRSPLRVVGALLDAGAVHPGRRARDHLLWMARAAGRRALAGHVPGPRPGRGPPRRPAGAGARRAGQRARPAGMVWMRGLLRSLAAQGRAVLVSSHLMSELEGSADHLVAIGRGRLVADTSVRDLLAAASGDRVVVRTSRRTEAMTVLANAGATVSATVREVVTVSGLPAERIVALLNGRGLAFSEVAGHRASLEEAYMELTRDAVELEAPAAGEA
jgi:ABC-2 type transport system ATP-binding protein